MSRFDKTLADAIKDLAQHGYSAHRMQLWLGQLRSALSSGPPQKKTARTLDTFYRRFWKQKQKVHGWNVEVIEPRFRHLLAARIQASADLIVLNRKQAIETVLHRFAGWASSVPEGGSRVIEKRKTASQIGKPIKSQTFVERRVSIDQGHKLLANIDAIVSEQQGAIAAVWRHVHQAHYDARPEHEARDGKVFTLRGNWALEKGLMKAGKNGYTDEIEQVGEAVYCRCWYEYLYSLRDLPPDMLTKKGRAVLDR